LCWNGRMKKLSDGLATLLNRGEAGKNFRLYGLWRNWREAVGADVAELARPLGHRRNVLFLGVEDSVAMQELSYLTPEILERANGFLGQNLFDKVQFDLLGTQIPLDAVRASYPDYYPARYEAPVNLGGLLGKFDGDSPVGRCYAKYVKFFQRSKS
jgi:hypothetical protein